MRPVQTDILLIILALIIVVATTGTVAAQGSIFGTVERSDNSVPPNGAILFFGFLDNTDEEIRIESSIGAGYESGNWFDDFQNYQSEAAGNPYAYHFYDLGQGESFVLSGLIPNNSFQQENIVLQAVTLPPVPVFQSGRFISETEIEITWNTAPATTVHVYRRMVPSEGSFFRIDDPAGSLAGPGVAGDTLFDPGVDALQSYQYLLIAEDISGQFSPHSEILTVSFVGGCCNIRGDINNSGGLPLDISDLVFLVEYMFAGGPEPVCLEEADINGDSGEAIDISDLVHLIDYMFLSGPPPVPCP